MSELLYALPIIGALIGWLTNWVAVKMLFHPKKPLRLLIVTVQGVFPKRQQAFAEKLGNVVANELFSVNEVTSKIREHATSKEILGLIQTRVREILEKKLEHYFPVVGMFVSETILDKIAKEFTAEIRSMLSELADRMALGVENEMDVASIVREKVANFSSDKLEDLLFAIMKREFRFVELVGAVLGFLIGSVQLAITWPN
ncbi:MAG: DUF445 domain-containing protein [Opitutae bacterium]|nr:DUF445 domain-containing protein [Opitutae bacterium]|tara:strand:- start:4645 stop:5247 length:603 start_codon:yes stop_codon:yes gene_type:complete